MSEKTLYIDDYGVQITNARFYTESQAIELHRIKQIGVERLAPEKRISVLLFAVGFLTIFLGSIDLFGDITFYDDFELYIVDGDAILVGIGVLSILVSVMRMILTKEKYVLKIQTKDGEITPVTSDKRYYIARLGATLKSAYYRYTKRQVA